MPFAPSHIAAALPFARTPLIPAALVIGTVQPDLFRSAARGQVAEGGRYLHCSSLHPF